jgi:hypothetical protein
MGFDVWGVYPIFGFMKLMRLYGAMLALGLMATGEIARAGSATDISGLYYTGQTSTGSLQAGGGRDANWDVTYAYVNGTRYRSYSGNSFADTQYTSTAGAYVLSSSFIDSAYVANTSSAQWITAPGAMTAASGGTANIGGVYLPGNGTTGDNRASYVYQLAFNVTGTGSGVVTNQMSISLTIAADDAYAIYVTPSAITMNGSGVLQTGGYSASATGTNAWNNTTAVSLQNFGSGGANNTVFNIGTNYLTIVVSNTNSVTGDSSSSALNPSGLLVYQVGALATIDGNPIPEAGTVLPLLGAVGLYGFLGLQRGRRRPAV